MFYRITRASLSFAVIAALSSLTGCASIVSGTSQVVSVETLHPSGAVAGAVCKLENDKGVYYVTTPGTVTVHRAYGDMNVKCEKSGFDPGLATVKSSTKAMMAGNIVFGGFIGAGVDAASGAAYDYPALFQVMMGQQQTIQTPIPQNQAQSPAPAQVATAGGTH
jgi:hypothetical protein